MNLTRREIQILGFVAQGEKQPEIALRLDMSRHTVNFYFDRVRQKLGAKTAAHAVAIAIRDRLIT